MTDDVLDTQLRDWRDVMIRLQQMTSGDSGASVLDVRILVIRGQPAYWFAPHKRTIEPSSSARAFCAALDGIEGA